jgi:RES domain-containing protein
VIFRSAPPKWAAGKDLLTGLGSMKAGARFNAAGTFAAIYGSTTPELAMIESLAFQRRAGLPVHRALPLIFKAFSADVQRMLDLTDAVVLSELGLNPADLRAEAWWLFRARAEESKTQAVGRAAHACGIQAIQAASAHTLDHGTNIIVFPDRILPPSRLKIVRGRPRR